jgi:lipoprotein NlpI
MRFALPALAAGVVAAATFVSATLVSATSVTAGTDYRELARLDTKDPGARQPTAKERSKSDLEQIIGYYNAAIKADPKDDDAYFHRGLANFYAGAVPLALADLARASKLDPQYAYYPLWTDIIEKRNNRAGHLAEVAAQLDMNKWPAPVIYMFLGETTPAAVLAAADDPDPKTKRGQICEANFYSGQLALRQGDRAEAVRRFRLAAADCTHEFVEGGAAKSELTALGEAW